MYESHDLMFGQEVGGKRSPAHTGFLPNQETFFHLNLSHDFFKKFESHLNKTLDKTRKDHVSYGFENSRRRMRHDNKTQSCPKGPSKSRGIHLFANIFLQNKPIRIFLKPNSSKEKEIHVSKKFNLKRRFLPQEKIIKTREEFNQESRFLVKFFHFLPTPTIQILGFLIQGLFKKIN